MDMNKFIWVFECIREWGNEKSSQSGKRMTVWVFWDDRHISYM